MRDSKKETSRTHDSPPTETGDFTFNHQGVFLFTVLHGGRTHNLPKLLACALFMAREPNEGFRPRLGPFGPKVFLLVAEFPPTDFLREIGTADLPRKFVGGARAADEENFIANRSDHGFLHWSPPRFRRGSDCWGGCPVKFANRPSLIFALFSNFTRHPLRSSHF